MSAYLKPAGLWATLRATEVHVKGTSYLLITLGLGSLTGCEPFEAARGLLDPLPRHGDATEAPTELAPTPEAKDKSPGSNHLSRLMIAEPLELWPVEKLTLVVALPWLTPPRAVVSTPDGYEGVIQLGGMLGQERALVSAIAQNSLTVTRVVMGADGLPALRPTTLTCAAPPAPPPGPGTPAAAAPPPTPDSANRAG